ncbi:MAG: hypothetical protein P8K68_10525 [Algibacter sp.]|uniref:hypothetical protein n=1 Tax=Algibacter sp. TaxID=1872428 RepID=UPI0026375232|nr:hypothetical protein [Algibacter sp.]MDG1730143.1 hypothetical protein [Algibacter sp.]MDG2179203.1 hypothetical protein [Algibacter sp.]
MKPQLYLSLLVLFFTLGCSSDDTNENEEPETDTLYFPPINSDTWETTTVSELGWNTSEIQPLLNYVESKGTKAFLILKNGKMIVEWYGTNSDADSNLPWNSAAKTLMAFTTGIAQEEGFFKY